MNLQEANALLLKRRNEIERQRGKHPDQRVPLQDILQGLTPNKQEVTEQNPILNQNWQLEIPRNLLRFVEKPSIQAWLKTKQNLTLFGGSPAIDKDELAETLALHYAEVTHKMDNAGNIMKTHIMPVHRSLTSTELMALKADRLPQLPPLLIVTNIGLEDLLYVSAKEQAHIRRVRYLNFAVLTPKTRKIMTTPIHMRKDGRFTREAVNTLGVEALQKLARTTTFLDIEELNR